MSETLPNRKPTRLKDYNYSRPGAYFITICTKDKQKLLSEIVGGGVLDAPQNHYTAFGEIANKYICQMNRFYQNISVEHYVIMPNHIHLLLQITDDDYGTSRTPSPTHSLISRFVGTFKRFCNEEYDKNIWQRSFHDHIIRDERDYRKISEYIQNNPAKWEMDCFYQKH